MLLISSESKRANPALIDVVREKSFSLSFFKTADTLAELMLGSSRRIVLLAKRDITDEVLQTLINAQERTPFAVIVAADRTVLCNDHYRQLVETLGSFENVEWVGRKFDFDKLSASTRRCRRRMLRISRQELEAAFDNDEFVLRYQPKVEREQGEEWIAREAEALVRWQHPENGLISPLEFLPEIEAFGLMGRLSEWVLQKVARQVITWRDSGVPLNACINLASSQLCDTSIAQRYADIIAELDLSCEQFTFEVVEQDLTKPDAPHIGVLKALRSHGFRVSLDDFRVAASSLSTIEQLPFDEIKVHASAMQRARDDKVAMTVLAAVTGLAHNLGMSVCAEGVEDESTFEFLTTIECDKMQGFLISEAVVPDIIQRVYSASKGHAA